MHAHADLDAGGKRLIIGGMRLFPIIWLSTALMAVSPGFGQGIVWAEGDDRLITAGGYTSPLSHDGLALTWSDEFSGREPDAADWAVSEAGNVSIRDGYLVLGAPHAAATGISTRGLREFAFGRIDIRARVPEQSGLQSSIYLGRSEQGEVRPPLSRLELMSTPGGPREVHGAVHWREQGGERFESASISLPAGTFGDQFHVFSLVWAAGTLRWLVDGYEFLAFDAARGEAPQRFFLGIELAPLAGIPPGADASPPPVFIVDYVRVFQPR